MLASRGGRKRTFIRPRDSHWSSDMGGAFLCNAAVGGLLGDRRDGGGGRSRLSGSVDRGPWAVGWGGGGGGRVVVGGGRGGGVGGGGGGGGGWGAVGGIIGAGC